MCERERERERERGGGGALLMLRVADVALLRSLASATYFLPFVFVFFFFSENPKASLCCSSMANSVFDVTCAWTSHNGYIPK